MTKETKPQGNQDKPNRIVEIISEIDESEIYRLLKKDPEYFKHGTGLAILEIMINDILNRQERPQ